MKRVLLYLLGLVFLAGLIFTLLFYPLVFDHFGRQPLPEVVRPAENGLLIPGDSLLLRVLPRLEEILFQTTSQLEAPAVSAAIGLGGELAWANAVGFADMATGRPATIKTQFRIGSVSKSVTAMGIGKLLESEALDIDRNIQSYVPYFGADKPEITIRQLASHTSGIRNYGFCWCLPAHEGLSNDHFASIRESVAIFSDDPLLFKPGTDFNYSTYNYTLISAAMEEITGQHYLDYMRRSVFGPLQMYATMGDPADAVPAERATFYEVKNGKYKNAFQVDVSNKWAGGGLISTPGDLVRMGNAILTDRFLQSATKALLWEPQKLSNGEINEQNYGIGWRIDTTEKILKDRSIRIVHHGGTITGGIALLMLFPDFDLVVAMTVNRSGSSGELFAPVYLLAGTIIRDMEKVE